MKKILLSIILLSLAIPCLADEPIDLARLSVGHAGAGGAAGACTRGTTLVSEDWETGYANGDPWSDHNWQQAEGDASVYTARSAVKKSGTYSGLANNAEGANGNRRIYHTFTEQTSGKITAEFYYYVNVNNDEGAFLSLNDNDVTAFGCNIMMSASGNLQAYNGSGWQTLQALNATTWYKIEIVADIDNYNQATFCTYYVDGTSKGSFAGYTAPDALSRVLVDTWSSSATLTYIDDLIVYDGDRCNP